VVEPFNTLEQAFSPYVADRAILEQLAPYFERITAPKDHVLWKQGDAADGLYVIGAGVLRATYRFAAHTPVIQESMVPGTLAGELSGLAGLARNATVVVERDAVLWRLDADALRRLEVERPELARTFTALVLKGACGHERMTLIAHAIWVGSRKIGLRYFALCIGDKAMKGRPLPRQRNPTKEMGITAYRYGLSFPFFLAQHCRHSCYLFDVAVKVCT
jgi:hypothetical protein